MESLRDELFFKLLKKTEELGRQVTFQEAADDPNLPNPNDYAYYYGSFSEAAKQAWNSVRRGDKFSRLEDRLKGVVIVSKKQQRRLSPERTTAVISEFVDMFIENDGIMPSSRDVKKNRYISEQEVQILRQNGELHESKIRKMAEEKAGRTFMTPNERRKKNAIEAREKRLEAIAKLEQEVQIEKEVKKMGDERKGKRYTPEECEEILRKLCREARHVLTQAEVAEAKDCPTWLVLQKQVGPWWTWDKLFNVPFTNEKQARIAAVKAQEAEEEKKLGRFMKGKEAALAQEPGTPEEELKALEEPKVPEEPKVLEEESGPELMAPDEAFVDGPEPEEAPENLEETPKISEEEPEVVEREDGMMEIPIKVILPKGIKGSIQISLEF